MRVFVKSSSVIITSPSAIESTSPEETSGVFSSMTRVGFRISVKNVCNHLLCFFRHSDFFSPIDPFRLRHVLAALLFEVEFRMFFL